MSRQLPGDTKEEGVDRAEDSKDSQGVALLGRGSGNP